MAAGPDEAIEEMERTYKRIARRVRPWTMLSLAQWITWKVEPNDHDIAKISPHKLARLTAASCAYYAGQNDIPIGPGTLSSVLARLPDIADPILEHLLRDRNDLLETFMLMGRNQFTLQNNLGAAPLGRFARVFCGVPPDNYKDILSLPLEDVLRCTTVLSAMDDKPWKLAQLTPELLALCSTTKEMFDKYLELFASDVDAVKREYLHRLKTTQPREWPHLRPIFEDHPAVIYGDNLLVPFRGYAVNVLNEVVHRRYARRFPRQATEVLTRNWEAYCHDLLSMLPEQTASVDEAELLVEGGLSADFAFVLPDCVLVLECKFVCLDLRWATAEAIFKRSDDIAYGIHQVVETAKRIKAGDHASLRAYREKPILGAVALVAMPPLLNSPEYWTRCWAPQLTKQGVEEADWRSVLHTPPQFLSAVDLEALVMFCRQKGHRLLDLTTAKLADRASIGSDWHNYLFKDRDLVADDQVMDFWIGPTNDIVWRDPNMLRMPDTE